LRHEQPQTVLSLAAARAALADTTRALPTHGALAGAWPDSLTSTPPDTAHSQIVLGEPRVQAGGGADSLPPNMPRLEPSWAGGQMHNFPVVEPDTTKPLPTTSPLVERGGPFAVSDSVLTQRASRYKVHLAPDYAGGGFYASNIGFVGATEFLLSDFLGN